MITAETAMGSSDLGDYLHECVTDEYWGIKLKAAAKPCQDLIDKCLAIGAISNDSSVWIGDADAYIWVEEIKPTKSYHTLRHALIIKNVVTCAENNVFIYDLDSMDDDFSATFHCVAVEDSEEVMRYNPRQFNDNRDWEKATLKTYRDHNFTFGYRDCRDRGHSFLLKHGSCEKATPHEVRFALRELMWAYNSIVEAEDYTKKN